MFQFLKQVRGIRQKVMGINQRNLELIYPHNARNNYKYADDKYLAKQLLESKGIACPQTYAVIHHIGEIEQVWQRLISHEALVLKPARGAGGKGIMILKRRGASWYEGQNRVTPETIFSHIANILFGIYSFGNDDCALVESYVQPHEFFHSLYPQGVPDIRIILLKGTPLMGMLRLPTAKSGGKANLHQGGLGIGIDIETGHLKKAYDGKQHRRDHPDSGIEITGLQLPLWQELIRLAVATSGHFPLEFLGVDLVIDAQLGPMIMEVNVRPGLAIQLANQQGLREILDQKNRTLCI